jgi:hypothetical protein
MPYGVVDDGWLFWGSRPLADFGRSSLMLPYVFYHSMV